MQEMPLEEKLFIGGDLNGCVGTNHNDLMAYIKDLVLEKKNEVSNSI